MSEQVISTLKRAAGAVKGDPSLAERLSDTASLIDDVELDSLQLLNFMLAVEDELSVEIDFEQLDFELLHSIEELSVFLSRMPRVA